MSHVSQFESFTRVLSFSPWHLLLLLVLDPQFTCQFLHLTYPSSSIKMSGKGNNTPNKKAGQQPSPSPSAQALVQLDIHPRNGRITFNNQSFANFDNVMQHIQEQPV